MMTRLHRPRLAIFTTALCFVLLGASWGSAQLVDHYWIGGTGSWDDPTRWLDQQVPNGPLARVHLGSGNDAAEVNITSGNFEAYSVRLGQAASLFIGDELALHDEFFNRGRVTIGGRVVLEDSLTLRGGGELDLQRPSFVDAFITTDFAQTVTNLDNTIRGSGRFGVHMLNIGSVIADITGSQLSVSGENYGTMYATNQATLSWSGFSTGVIEAQQGSTVVLGGNPMYPSRGGLYRAAGGTNPGLIEIVGAIQDIEFEGNVVVDDGQLDGNIINCGNMRFDGFRSTAISPLFSGGGTIELSGTQLWIGGDDPHQLGNIDNRVFGYGHIRHHSIHNGGTIEATEPMNTMRIELAGGYNRPSSLTNTGILAATNGSTLRVDGISNPTSELRNAGGVIQVESDSRFETAAIVVGGTVEGVDTGGNDPPLLSGAFEHATFRGNLDASIGLVGSATIDGQIRIDQQMSYLGNVDLLGEGSIDLNGKHFVGPTSGSTFRGLFNRSITIKGSGHIEAGLFENSGTVVADRPGGTLSINTAQSSVYEFRNTGQLQARNAGMLYIGEVDNTRGLIEAFDGSMVVAGEIYGGSIASEGSGVVLASKLINVRNTGYVIPSGNSSRFQLEGTIVNDGTISNTYNMQTVPLRDGFGFTTSVFLQGAGVLELAGNSNELYQVVNGVDHSITATGILETDRFVNHGLFWAQGDFLLEANQLTNYGVIRGPISFGAPFQYPFNDPAAIVNQGTFDVGLHTIVMQDSGTTFRNGADGRIVMELGDVDGAQIDVHGAADLAGELSLTIDAAATVPYGTEYPIILTDPLLRFGTFDTIHGVLVDDATALATTYEDSRVLVTVALPGDANLDGTVDAQDFVLWNDHKFTSNGTWATGDFNGDGLVNGRDFVVWNDHKFTTADYLSLPEPAYRTWMMGVLLLMGSRWFRSECSCESWMTD